MPGPRIAISLSSIPAFPVRTLPPRSQEAPAAIRHMTRANVNTMERPWWNGAEIRPGKKECPVMAACRAMGAPAAAKDAVSVLGVICLLTVIWRPLEVVSVLLPSSVGKRVGWWVNPYAPPRQPDWDSAIRAEPPEWTEIDHWEYRKRAFEVYSGIMQLEIEQYLGDNGGQQQRPE